MSGFERPQPTEIRQYVQLMGAGTGCIGVAAGAINPDQAHKRFDVAWPRLQHALVRDARSLGFVRRELDQRG